jgi:regulator of sigma E protease
MSTTLATIIAFPIVLGILIFVHELGHFSMAKLFKVRVFEFALGFPPRLASVTRGETMYSLNMLPFGGYVRMMGENGTDADNPSSFGFKPWWQRAIILTAGPAMNVLLALFLFFLSAAWLGSPVGTNVVSSISPGSPAQRAGLHSGDRIVAVDGHPTHSLATVHDRTDAHLGHKVVLTVVHGGHQRLVTVVPRPLSDRPANQGAVGVTMTIYEQRYPLGTSVGKSFDGVGTAIMAVPNLIASIGKHGTQGVSGPIGIARYTGDAASNIPQYGLGQFIAFMALLSANLGVLNLLPVPGLDGGRMVFVLLSGVRRRNLNPEVEGLVHLVGLAVLVLLILFISYQDILHWASGQ